MKKHSYFGAVAVGFIAAAIILFAVYASFLIPGNFSSTPTGMLALSSYSCSDSDGGKNYSKPGIVALRNFPFSTQYYKDFCLDPKLLKEYYCRFNVWNFSYSASYVTYKCPNKCNPAGPAYCT